MGNFTNIINEQAHPRLSKTEQLIAAMAGFILIAAGVRNLRKDNQRGYAELLCGAYLLFKGASGHAPFRKETLQSVANETADATLDITV
ncbi:hypothetical protein [Deminuibacter soli]|uniref:DUF2892 domain-containing protein n=1 Tax=Deminuibacter soli TaxID=2291815 RepID=A0A3E1NEN7_9BACT|nr:hypothetical protein [Deminuibacter soli]RFM26337.1 hypothetical protein DXN05_20730 [Deminuibacter soli]